MPVRFLHTSDLHLGKRFGNLPEDLRGRLKDARHTAIDRLASQARAHNTDIILIAGDVFDTETPAPAILRQAIASMGSYSDLRWVLLPGNHDSLQAEELWQTVADNKPDNLLLAMSPAPLPLSDQAVLLPAACTTRRPGRDLTAWMSDADTGSAIRIGLAHGAIQTFSEDALATDIIAPDRARLSGLDYLALGDWHGQMRINDRTWYSGTPEPDRFKHNRPGMALIVSINEPGAIPDVTPVQTGLFEWSTLTLDILSGEDPAEALMARLPLSSLRRHILLTIAVSGRANMAGRASLTSTVASVAPEFALANLLTDDLFTDCAIADLDQIDTAGALRHTADTLMAHSTDPALAEDERRIASDALMRLFSYCEDIRV
ncbi:MAG: DNA repair exonuclease [Asticcacaulis sp.]